MFFARLHVKAVIYKILEYGFQKKQAWEGRRLQRFIVFNGALAGQPINGVLCKYFSIKDVELLHIQSSYKWMCRSDTSLSLSVYFSVR